jgi:hypothetical protein
MDFRPRHGILVFGFMFFILIERIHPDGIRVNVFFSRSPNKRIAFGITFATDFGIWPPL